MKHVLTILTQAAEGAENDAKTREACADSCARDGDLDRAENLRAQAALDRAIVAECQELIPFVQLMATIKEETAGMSEEELREGMKMLIQEARLWPGLSPVEDETTRSVLTDEAPELA